MGLWHSPLGQRWPVSRRWFIFGALLFAWQVSPPVRGSEIVATTSAASLPKVHPREHTYLRRQWGIEVLYVRQTAAGYMLEFRYRVHDAQKAKPLFERQAKPKLIDAASGAQLIVPTPPKTGALRNSNPPLAGRTYWMFFANPGQLVKPGNRVNIAIGAFSVEGLVVQ